VAERLLSPDEWNTVKGAAAIARVSESTILREARAGRLVGYKVGGRRNWRFRTSAVDAWLEAQTPEFAEQRHQLRLANR
jgi:excisionase family DNA binding protein